MDEKKLIGLLQTALQPVTDRLGIIEIGLQELRTEQQEMRAGLQELRTEMNQQFEEVKGSIQRIEENQAQDINAMLHRIYGKLEDKDFEVSVLNKRIFRVETEIERMNKQ